MEENIIFLCGIFPSELYNELTDLKVNKNIQIAANALQWHLINALEKNLNKSIKLINVPFIGSFPRQYTKPAIKKFYFSHCENAIDVNVGFMNLPLWRHISIMIHRHRYVKKWIQENQKGYVITYALTLRNIYQLTYLKKKNPNIKTCMIVPDLPMYMRMNGTNLYKALKKLETKLIKRKLKDVDGYILLTKQMNDFIATEKYCVIEGIATEGRPDPTYSDNKNKIIFYSGTLDKKYGIIELLQAFNGIKEDTYRLYICGKGDCEQYVLNSAKYDSRINYLGQISYAEVLQYQQMSTVLINPRKNENAFTKYSFPSKTLEYLSAGIPLIAYKLDGIPNEYDKYILYIENNSISAMRNKIVEVLEYSDEKRKEIGNRARNFVLKEKNELAQGKKILRFLSEL